MDKYFYMFSQLVYSISKISLKYVYCFVPFFLRDGSAAPYDFIIKTGRVVKCTSGMLPRSCDFWYHVINIFQTREARFLFDDEFVNNIIKYV